MGAVVWSIPCDQGKILVGRCNVLCVATPAMSEAAALSTVSSISKFTSQQIHDYALALLQILQVRKTATSQGVAISSDAQPRMQASSQIAQILDRNDLDGATFNAISSDAETQRSLRRQVRQTMIHELVGF